MAAEKPKPCPFCGGDPIVQTRVVGCRKTRCTATVRATGKDREDAIRRWNTREGSTR